MHLLKIFDDSSRFNENLAIWEDEGRDSLGFDK